MDRHISHLVSVQLLLSTSKQELQIELTVKTHTFMIIKLLCLIKFNKVPVNNVFTNISFTIFALAIIAAACKLDLYRRTVMFSVATY